ncbi:MAG TPA: hypothetical protein VED63_07990 [Acidimicrobiales bacterium]|nr:hypothetical protein [Acidimicrobiales bacterium]
MRGPGHITAQPVQLEVQRDAQRHLEPAAFDGPTLEIDAPHLT